GVRASGQGGQQVLPQLLPQAPVGVSGGAQLAEGLDLRHLAHPSTVARRAPVWAGRDVPWHRCPPLMSPSPPIPPQVPIPPPMSPSIPRRLTAPVAPRSGPPCSCWCATESRPPPAPCGPAAHP